MNAGTEPDEYEVVVVGGGPAGMTAALYSTRLGHRTALLDRGGGRGAMMQEVHNLLGVTEETSSAEFLAVGTEQLEDYGCDVHRDMVTTCSRRDDESIRLSANAAEYDTEIVVLATGFTDVRPDPPLHAPAADFITVSTRCHHVELHRRRRLAHPR